MISFQTHPSKYKHWKLEFSDTHKNILKLIMQVQPDKGLKEGYSLKLNSYDLSVDIELSDAVERIRFEYPEIDTVIITSESDKVFCAGANIMMLGQSQHDFKVNFCKFTNETRLSMEEASRNSGIKFIAALNGIAAGGGYELALACDQILLVDDGNSAVSLPEVPLLGVLPGTGGLTRLSDKRKIRRDHADIFCTVAEGIKGKRAVEWRFVDKLISKSKWQEGVMSEAILLSSQTAKSKMDSSLQLNDQGPRNNKAVELKYLDSKITDSPELFSKTYSHVEFRVFKETRKAEVKLLSPKPEAELKKWALQTYRELNDAILNLRANFSEIGLWEFKTEGDANKILEAEKNLPHETVSFIKRTLRRVEVSSRSIVTLIEQNSCFSGSLAELVFIADRSFMLEESADVVLSHMNLKQLPMHNGLSRLEARYEYDLELFEKITAMSRDQSFSAEDCEELGLVTAVLDDIDYPDEVRLFEEERASMSPDALVGLEANLRYVGPENMATRIFGRLSAWQNWIFTRENACGPKGALTNYATPTKPEFDLRRC